MLGLDRPLVGFLTRDRLIEPGASVSVQGWVAPMLEAEVAVHLGRDVDAGAPQEKVVAAITGLSAAIELADVDPPPRDVEQILAGNIFHRYVVLGPVDRDRSDLEGVTGLVTRNGIEVDRADDPEALTGRLLDVVAALADRLAAGGERLQAGDVVIAGSVVTPVPIAPGDLMTVSLGGLGELSLRIT